MPVMWPRGGGRKLSRQLVIVIESNTHTKAATGNAFQTLFK